jgi:DNA topoisomerase VI subunit A
MDNDPHGLDIYATYKWGARVHMKANIQWINLLTSLCTGYGI